MSERFEHKKSLGQHFLNSDYVPKQMCDAANLSGGEAVVEVGPGTGALTKEILARGCKVVAIEADERAISTLEETFSEEIAREQLVIHHHDARILNPEDFNLKPHTYKVVANIPYYLSGSLFRSFLDTKCQPTDLVYLVQKEVAERIARDPKESLLSLSVKAFGEPKYIATVKKGNFTPPPKVDSAIIAIRNISQKHFKKLDSQLFFEILHLGFGQKRKQLFGLLKANFASDSLEDTFAKLSLKQDIRAEDVPVEKWLELSSYLQTTH